LALRYDIGRQPFAERLRRRSPTLHTGKKLQYSVFPSSAFKLPHGNTVFGERRLPEIASLGQFDSIP
jgi:hypothetical protein